MAKYFSYSEAVDPDKPAETLKALVKWTSFV